MLSKWQFWLLTVLAAGTVATIAANMVRFADNRRQQAEVAQRAQYIQQTVPLEALSREIVGALAQLSVRNQDDQIRSMLSGLGFKVNETAAPQQPAQTAAQPRKK